MIIDIAAKLPTQHIQIEILKVFESVEKTVHICLVGMHRFEAKIAQLLVFGATVLLVDGTYDDAFELCLEAAPEFGWYNRNTAYNPYMSEGKKTAAYEICEQLGYALGPPTGWRAPDRIFIPVGGKNVIRVILY